MTKQAELPEFIRDLEIERMLSMSAVEVPFPKQNDDDNDEPKSC